MQRKILTSILSIALFLGVALVQADPTAESPQQGLSAILKFYKAKDWDGLIKNRCPDAKHAESEEALKTLVDSVGQQFSDPDMLNAVVASFEAALVKTPRIEAEGTVAIFSSELGSVKLSKMDNGIWGLRF